VLRAQPEALERQAQRQPVLQAQQLRALAPLREPELRLVLACWLQELQLGVPGEPPPELGEQQKR
jgi:hypothetical protein